MKGLKWKKKPLYIASYLQDSEDDYLNVVPVYDKPRYIGLENIQPLSDTNGTYGIEVAGFGTKVIKMQKVLLDVGFRILNDITVKSINEMTVEELNSLSVAKLYLKYDQDSFEIKENDLAYLDGVTPDGEAINGENANYTVVAVRNQNKKIAIYFEKLPNK